MPPQHFRDAAHEVVDWMADYLESVEQYPVLSRVAAGETADALPASAPESGVPFPEILGDFRDIVLPGVTHWNHPGFFAYFGITASGPGILGEMLTAALNVNAMLWRTGPAPTELEERSLEWLRQMMGLPDGFHGHIQDTASISTLVALATAREVAELGIREHGLSGRDVPRLRVYCSDQAHSSVDRAGITIGLGSAGTRRVATDDAFRMDPAALAAAILEDLQAGIRPLAVVATVGTTSTTSVDPVRAVGEICREHGLWLHVDAAYGGAAALLPELRRILDGCELADSLVVNPHKWLFVPIDCSALFVRDPQAVRRAFSLVPEYLLTPEGESVTNLMDFGPALGRRFRSLKLWMTLRYFGREGIAARIREHIRLAGLFASWVQEDPAWELSAPTPFSTVCFRYTAGGAPAGDADRVNDRILQRVNESGEVFLSHTRLRDRLVLRLAVGNIRTEERHLRRAWELLRSAAAEMGEGRAS